MLPHRRGQRKQNGVNRTETDVDTEPIANFPLTPRRRNHDLALDRRLTSTL